MTKKRVSIPIGFSHQLRRPGPRPAAGGGPGFNPYRVFSSAETQFCVRDLALVEVVSIPIGFSHQLRRGIGRARLDDLSFNPYRVFSSAETTPRHRKRSSPRSFNPYRVFSSAETIRRTWPGWWSCCFNPYRVFSSAETDSARAPDRPRQVSIPIGFSHQLRPYPVHRRRRAPPVSIPIGFSHQLRLARGAVHDLQPSSFNPYRVFSSAETVPGGRWGW